jgi:alpha/beta superfamily hydrolase
MPSHHKFSVTGTAGNIEGVTHLPEAEERAIAVVAHPLPTLGGSMENKVVTTLVKTFVELGCATLRFNFRGVGGSEGVFDDGNGEVEDALVVIDYARQQYGQLPLILSGFSFGGFVQARVAQQLQPDHLVLIAPAVGRFSMPNVPGKTLLIHGDQDDVVPLGEVLQWARPQALPIIVLPGAEHYFHGRLNQIKQLVLQHFIGLPL